MRYKAQGRGFDSRLCHWSFSFNFSLHAAQWPYSLNRMNHDFVTLIVTMYENYVELHLIKMEHHHIMRFLFGRGLEKIFLVGGLGVENQHNDLSEDAFSLHGIYFRVFRLKSKQK
jgi:hypothetical protein